jgi:hypothetical protein
MATKSRVARWHIFQTKNPILGKLWKALQRKMLIFLLPFCLVYGHMVYFMAIRYNLWSFGIFFPRFGMLYGEKSGNPAKSDSGFFSTFMDCKVQAAIHSSLCSGQIPF